ncbi:TnsA-like heteromeric transposase endonuclease subunit [Streptomyces olivaceus]|uniref:TnsA-like heteromeric transposase endonuclease subunit n=1 Tax=Streptomyces olivaceus TaxID=47716 RepID=UPI001CCE8F39|nr:TnsA-like heteromeric transposase endonuclease subunit [Streptomyces olivaceus]MBZ6135458.1 TnsA-like heteromeric transposase endonuclease subunit [Streptomyces olivaceus]
MAEGLRIVHRNGAGREVQVPAEQAGTVEMFDREPVWVPLRHHSERSIVTYWWAATTGKHVGCRSLQRLSMAMLLDFHPQVSDFAAWTARLEWTEQGRVRRFVPDFFVRTAHGATVVVSCPPASGASRRWEKQRHVLEQACDAAGWQLGTPRLPQGHALANLRWVARYRHPRYADEAVERQVLEAFARPRPLLEGVEGCGVPRLASLPRLYHLLWRRELSVDWSVPLNPASVVRPGGAAPAMDPFMAGEQA